MRPRGRIGIASLGLLALAACGSGGPVRSTPGSDVVAATEVRAVKSYRFEPTEIQVDAGSSVTWSNEDNFAHTVRLLDGSHPTEDLRVGGSASITFETPGLVRYECSLHPAQMKGSVLVE